MSNQLELEKALEIIRQCEVKVEEDPKKTCKELMGLLFTHREALKKLARFKKLPIESDWMFLAVLVANRASVMLPNLELRTICPITFDQPAKGLSHVLPHFFFRYESLTTVSVGTGRRMPSKNAGFFGYSQSMERKMSVVENRLAEFDKSIQSSDLDISETCSKQLLTGYFTVAWRSLALTVEARQMRQMNAVGLNIRQGLFALRGLVGVESANDIAANGWRMCLALGPTNCGQSVGAMVPDGIKVGSIEGHMFFGGRVHANACMLYYNLLPSELNPPVFPPFLIPLDGKAKQIRRNLIAINVQKEETMRINANAAAVLRPGEAPFPENLRRQLQTAPTVSIPSVLMWTQTDVISTIFKKTQWSEDKTVQIFEKGAKMVAVVKVSLGPTVFVGGFDVDKDTRTITPCKDCEKLQALKDLSSFRLRWRNAVVNGEISF